MNVKHIMDIIKQLDGAESYETLRHIAYFSVGMLYGLTALEVLDENKKEPEKDDLPF